MSASRCFGTVGSCCVDFPGRSGRQRSGHWAAVAGESTWKPVCSGGCNFCFYFFPVCNSHNASLRRSSFGPPSPSRAESRGKNSKMCKKTNLKLSQKRERRDGLFIRIFIFNERRVSAFKNAFFKLRIIYNLTANLLLPQCSKRSAE